MKEIIIIDKTEFNNLLINFAKILKEYMNKGYAFKMINNETGKEIKELNEIIGSLIIPFEKLLLKKE